MTNEQPAATRPQDSTPVSAEASLATPGRSGNPISWVRGLLSAAARWETLLLAILAVVVYEGMQISPYFLQLDFWNSPNFGASVSGTMEVAIMALAMTPIIITGDIDLSVESMVGLSGAVLGVLWVAGLPLVVVIPIVLGVGVLGGLFNGLMVTRLGLPALVVTLGTLALYRGLANAVLGTSYVSNFPSELTTFGFGYVPGTAVPWTLLAFLILAVVFTAVMHLTWIGRQVFAVGKNKDAARYSGVRVALQQRPGRQRHRADTDGRLDRRARRCRHQRRQGHRPGRHPRRLHFGRAPERVAPGRSLERVPERRHRAASDLLGHHSAHCSPIPGIGRSRSLRSTPAGSRPSTWRGRSVA